MIDLGGAAPRIGVFRALVLGDMLCATPALRTLRAAWPQAEITLIGLPWAEALVDRLPSLDRFIAFPGHAGLPERAADEAAWPAFVDELRSHRFDLLLQMHGSGGITNPLVAGWGARHCAGFAEPGAWRPEPQLFAPWPVRGHEIERLLALTDRLGLARQGLYLDFPLRDDERGAVAARWPGPNVCLHPGAQLASRRWRPERFAAIGDLLASRGYEVLITGTAGEAAIANEVAAAMHAPSQVLAGQTTLWTLGALIERSALLVCNDTGVSHIAAALHTPSVVVSLGAEVSRWAPLDRQRHRVLWEPVACRPCAHAVCPVGHGCSTGLELRRVADAVLQVLDTAPARVRQPETAQAAY
ncbi:glycosyltransferase family 9 protein [Piscinibacter gummiphilus]|uniref:Glycosyltransferase family 9 protein n=1 Tax=Piscinibacter gummiphilus TaxID=946333 RepID=A0ABZ0CTD6_9BURK|nr:glycosyltransferase family 9 protein [Piscinibacter gummiphilus]WOB06148.1 glycosyltransferase family 9 protein [Piscinibacter gummiphilus]